MPSCSKCGEVIENQAVVVGETAFHRECFTCNVCGSEIVGEFVIRDGQSICLHCYNELNATPMNGQQRMKACSKCGGLIQGRGVQHQGEKFEFHRECLLCMMCQNPLGSKYEGGNVCLDCYREKLYPAWNQPAKHLMSDEL